MNPTPLLALLFIALTSATSWEGQRPQPTFRRAGPGRRLPGFQGEYEAPESSNVGGREAETAGRQASRESALPSRTEEQRPAAAVRPASRPSAAVQQQPQQANRPSGYENSYRGRPGYAGQPAARYVGQQQQHQQQQQQQQQPAAANLATRQSNHGGRQAYGGNIPVAYPARQSHLMGRPILGHAQGYGSPSGSHPSYGNQPGAAYSNQPGSQDVYGNQPAPQQAVYGSQPDPQVAYVLGQGEQQAIYGNQPQAVPQAVYGNDPSGAQRFEGEAEEEYYIIPGMEYYANPGGPYRR